MSLLQIGKQLGKRKHGAAETGRPDGMETGRAPGRIYLSCSSEGYGHSSRALAITAHLPAENVLIGTYSYALDRVRACPGLDPKRNSVEVSQELKFIGTQGSFDVGQTILQNPTRALSFNHIIQEEVNIIRQNDISLVVADGRMAPVLAASKLNVPCVVITNQSAFYPFFEKESELVKLFGWSFEWVMKLWLSSAEEILIPDFPPPYTVCLPNLSAQYQVKKRTRFVGPLVAWEPDQIQPVVKPSPDRPLVVACTGGHSYRRPMFDAVIEVAGLLSDIDFIIISPFTVADVPANVRLLDKVPTAAPYLKAADAVITQSGHSTAMELLTLGVPCVTIPDTRQIEQENNAIRMEALGVARKIAYEDLMIPHQAILKQAVLEVLNTPDYRNTARDFAERARLLQGARHTARLLQEYAGRLHAY
ncbi:MAG: glycosyltransferase [Candidatus Melainabacteria bacterium]